MLVESADQKTKKNNVMENAKIVSCKCIYVRELPVGIPSRGCCAGDPC